MTVARLSDHVPIPLQPSFPDLAAITTTIEIADVAKTPATIVLNLPLVNMARRNREARHDATRDPAPVARFGFRLELVDQRRHRFGVVRQR